MQIFRRDVSGSNDIWKLHSQLAQTRELWKPETFTEAATKCGPRKITARRDYFSFSGNHNMTGHAPVIDFIEEIHPFVGQHITSIGNCLRMFKDLF